MGENPEGAAGSRYKGMFYLKACARCDGDLYIDGDYYGSFLRCLQCGRLTEINVPRSGDLRTRRTTARKQAA